MINRLFGTLCALAIIAVMVFAILNRGNYTSMCFKDTPKADVIVITPASEPIVEEVITTSSEPENIEPQDSLSL